MTTLTYTEVGDYLATVGCLWTVTADLIFHAEGLDLLTDEVDKRIVDDFIDHSDCTNDQSNDQSEGFL